MRNSTKVVAALGGAALVVAAGSAFTASNSVPAAGLDGYGATAVSGLTITAMHINPTAADPALLDTVTYTTSTTLATGGNPDVVTLTLNPGVPAQETFDTCVVTGTAGSQLITCTPTTPGDITIASIEGLGLTASSANVN